MTEFTYRNDEFELDGALICADVEITLTWDWFDGEPCNFRVYQAEYKEPLHDRCPAWLREAMSSWVTANQTKLTQSYYDRETYKDAA